MHPRTYVKCRQVPNNGAHCNGIVHRACAANDLTSRGFGNYFRDTTLVRFDPELIMAAEKKRYYSKFIDMCNQKFEVNSRSGSWHGLLLGNKLTGKFNFIFFGFERIVQPGIQNSLHHLPIDRAGFQPHFFQIPAF